MTSPARSLASLFACSALVIGLAACGDGETPPDNNKKDGGGETATCTGDNECGAGKICVGNECVSNKCSSDADCRRTGWTCDLLNGVCIDNGPVENPDGGSVETPDGGSVETPDGGGNPGGPCTDKYDCHDGQICKANKCVAPPASCANDNDCPTGNICNFSRRCEPGCVSERDCPTGKLCHPQKFICESCSATNPCANGFSCIGGACQEQKSCTSAQDCKNQGLDGAVCLANKCSNCAGHSDCAVEPYKSERRVCATDGLCKKVQCNDENCRGALGPRGYCDTAANECKQRECLSDSDCQQSGTVCNTATYTCSGSSAGCDQATYQQCEQSCGAQGLACNPATCACGGGGTGTGGDGDPCVSSADCSQGYSCGLGICSPAAVDPVTGAECTDGFTCLACVNGVTGAACDPMGCIMSLLFGGVICL